MDLTDARSLEFAGGNPDESLYAILRFLSSAPARWRLPIVWNCHAYATKDTVALLDGIVDVWLPDLKYGNDTCAIRWSGAPGYAGAAFSSIAGMANQGAPVIVRILVLPGHVACCHGPALRSLAGLKGGNVTVSVRAQYAPDWRIERGQDPMGRRVRREEVAAVEQTCRDLGLRMIDSQLSSMRPKPM
jgi:putative pyruvate formate lyase activating enzyme